MSNQTHALLGLRAEIIKNPDTNEAMSISIVEPGDDSLVNLTLIFDLGSGELVEARTIAALTEELLNDGNEI